MGLLDKLWDDTVAGPQPDAGLGKLRKSASASIRTTPPPPVEIPITRSITILRSTSDSCTFSPDPSSSPSTPTSPFTPGTPRGNWRRLMRRKSESLERAEPRSPTVYDWVVISALDR